MPKEYDFIWGNEIPMDEYVYVDEEFETITDFDLFEVDMEWMLQ